MAKVETIYVKGQFEELGKIDLFPYSEEVEQITRRDEHCNFLIFSGNTFEFYRNFEDGQPMTTTKVFVMNDFCGFGLYNGDLDKIGEKVGVVRRFQGDRLSFYVGDYEIWSPFESLKGFINFGITYDKLGDYYRPIVLELTEQNRISKVVYLPLYCKDLYTLRLYVAENRYGIAEYSYEGKYSLDTYIAGPGEQERERLSREKLGIMSVQPTE